MAQSARVSCREFTRRSLRGLMRYKRWTDADGELEDPIAELWTEIDEAGSVTREIGFDRDGHVVHLMPASGFKHGTYGLFDLALVDPRPSGSDLAPAQFETTWTAALNASRR